MGGESSRRGAAGKPSAYSLHQPRRRDDRITDLHHDLGAPQRPKRSDPCIARALRAILSLATETTRHDDATSPSGGGRRSRRDLASAPPLVGPPARRSPDTVPARHMSASLDCCATVVEVSRTRRKPPAVRDGWRDRGAGSRPARSAPRPPRQRAGLRGVSRLHRRWAASARGRTATGHGTRRECRARPRGA